MHSSNAIQKGELSLIDQAKLATRRVTQQFQRELILFLSLVLLVLVFSLTNETFLTAVNLWNILAQSTPILIISFGMTVVIISAGIDLSVGSVASLTGVIFVWMLLQFSTPVLVGLVTTLAAGALIGIANGLVVSRLGVPDFIATLAMFSVARGAAFLLSGGFTIRSDAPLLTYFYNGSLGPVPVPVVIMVLVFAIVYTMLRHTPLGRSFYAIGGNRKTARLAGFNVQRVTIFAYLIVGLLTALSGIITSSRMAAGSPTIGIGWELEAVAIVILGGTNLFGGEGSLIGTLLAGLLIGMINNWMSLTGLAWWMQGFVVGSILILVVALNQRQISEKFSA